jgi:hypothetical protein
MKRLRAADLTRGSIMAGFHDRHDRLPGIGRAITEVRQVPKLATLARVRGHLAVADDLRREAQVLAAVLVQQQAALDDVRRAVSDLERDANRCWERLADDRPMHDHADDAGVLLALPDDLTRARDRVMPQWMTRP